MIVILGGMQRSGSTFSFNITREILSECGGVSVMAENSLDPKLQSENSTPHLIVKTHHPEPLITDLIKKGKLLCICTFRKPEDAVASWMRTFNSDLETSIAEIGGWLDWYRGISNYALCIDFTTIDRFPLIAILKIQRYLLGSIKLIDAIKLWFKYDKKRLKRQYDALEENPGTKNIGYSYYDKETFFHRRHINSVKSRPAQIDLTPEQILLIREHLKDSVDSAGNCRVEKE